MAQCMAMGEAAGTTAALAIEHYSDIRDLPVNIVRDRLRANGVLLEVPAS